VFFFFFYLKSKFIKFIKENMHIDDMISFF